MTIRVARHVVIPDLLSVRVRAPAAAARAFSGVAPTITPTFGGEMLTDGDMELVGVANWANYGTPTSVAKNGTIKYAGAQSLAIGVDTQSDGAQQAVNLTGSTWYAMSGYIYSAATVGENIKFNVSDGTFQVGWVRSASWNYRYGAALELGTAARAVWVESRDAGTATIYCDNLSMKPVTLASCLAQMVDPATRNVNIKCTPTLGSGVVAPVGIAMGIDSVTVPTCGVFIQLANGVPAHSGNSIRVWKLLSGGWTSVMGTMGITYSATAPLELRWVSGTTYRAYYNNSQVGSDLTIDTTGLGTLVCAWSLTSGHSAGTVTATW